MSAPTGLARLLLALAQRLMPACRREWSEAMRSEFEYLPRGAESSWAAGCLVAVIKQRFASMENDNLRVARWILLVETMGCFGPAVFAWWEFTFGPSGLARINAASVDKLFFSVPGGDWAFALWLAFGIAGLVSVLGLGLGLRHFWTGRALRNRVLGFSMLAVLASHSLAATVALLVNGPSAFSIRLEMFVLLTLLPAAAIAHLLYLGRLPVPPAQAGHRHTRAARPAPTGPEHPSRLVAAIAS